MVTFYNQITDEEIDTYGRENRRRTTGCCT